MAPRSRWCVHKLYIHPFYRLALISKVFAALPIKTGSSFTHMRNAPEFVLICRVPVEGGLCNRENLKKDGPLANIWSKHLHFCPLTCGGQCGFGG